MSRAVTSRQDLDHTQTRIALMEQLGPLEVVDVDLRSGIASFQGATFPGSEEAPTRVPISMVNPLSEEDSVRFWRKLGEKLVARLQEEGRLPKFYRSFSVSLGEDSTGDPAVYFKVFVDAPKGVAPDSTVTRWNEFTHEVLGRLLRLRLKRQPYVFLGAA